MMPQPTEKTKRKSNAFIDAKPVPARIIRKRVNQALRHISRASKVKQIAGTRAEPNIILAGLILAELRDLLAA